MRVMVTGANGFVGQTLVKHLLLTGELRGQRIQALLLLDQHLNGVPSDERVRCHVGSIANSALIRRALADGVDVVFHLVSIPGGAAESQYELGQQINLKASLELLEQLRNAGSPPVLVYASSVAVYGSDLPTHMTESQTPRPQLSYGTQKLMVETAIQDLGRRGEVDGRVLRLPGIVARPREPNGLRSAFMSDLLHAYASGEAYTCPVSPAATAWWMSSRCCVRNLIHAAEIPTIKGERIWQLPVLRLSISQVLDALAARFGADQLDRIEFAPDQQLETLFGRYPAIRTPKARAMGFSHDGSAAALLRNALPAIPGRTNNAKKTKGACTV